MKIFAKLTTITAGYDAEQREVKALIEKGVLKLGDKYELKFGTISNWCSSITLKDVEPEKHNSFNSVFFTFYSEDNIELNITDKRVIKAYNHLLIDY